LFAPVACARLARMLDQERKQLERDIYNRQANMERPLFGSYWDADLYKRLHAFAYDREVEELGARYMTNRKVLALGAGLSEAKFALRFSSDVHPLNISERAVDELKRRVPEANSFVGDAEHLDLDQRRDWLALFPFLATRRPDTYGPLVD